MKKNMLMLFIAVGLSLVTMGQNTVTKFESSSGGWKGGEVSKPVMLYGKIEATLHVTTLYDYRKSYYYVEFKNTSNEKLFFTTGIGTDGSVAAAYNIAIGPGETKSWTETLDSKEPVIYLATSTPKVDKSSTKIIK